MKLIALLTLRPYVNIGGILQAYALKQTLHNNGYDVLFIDRSANLNKFQKIIAPLYYSYKIFRTRKTHAFVRKHLYSNRLKVSDAFTLRNLYSKDIAAWIVGSDQVWRRDYIRKYGNEYFLDFISGATKKIAYAASFGVDNCEYNLSERKSISTLLSSFDLISIREESGLKILKEEFQIENASWVVDPTFLLSANDYLQLIENHKVIKYENYIFSYFLCAKEKVESLIEYSSILLKKNEITYFLKYVYENYKNPISVEQWLANIYYADFVITDSFHGCVFAIIFNKQFAVVRNDGGGNTRIDSLLKQFSISDRIIKQKEDINRLFQENINYSQVNEILKRERIASLKLLFNALN